MGKLSDYLHAVKQGLKNPLLVIEGNINRVKDAIGILPEDQKEVIEKRLSICVECPFNSFNASGTGFYETSRDDLHCSVCSCPIESKVASLDSNCGLELLAYRTDPQGNHTSGLYGYNKPLWTAYTPKNKE